MVDIKVGDRLIVHADRIPQPGHSCWKGVDGSIVTSINGIEIHYKNGEHDDWFDRWFIDEGSITIYKSHKPTPKHLDAKKKRIIKEIRGKPEFAKQFKNIKKDVESWSEEQVLNWFK